MAGECFPPVERGSQQTSAADPLSAYRARGGKFVAGLNGLFAGVLTDSRRRVAYLFNDRYGAEHIYFHIRDGVLYFASEAKALLSVLPELRAFDEDGVAQFLAFGSTHADKTLFRGISRLPGGSVWTWERGAGLRRERYFDVAEWEAQGELTESAFEEEFVETARAVLPMYARSSSPIGISITGGLDTRMLMACLPEGAKPVCHTYAAQTGETLDVSVGRRVAHSMGLEHHMLRITSEFVADLAEHIDRTVFVTDGGHTALGAHELFLSERARELAPIRLTGSFGSEILRSMSTLKRLKLVQRGVVDAAFAPRVEQWAEARRSAHPLTRTAFEEVPIHLFGPMAATRSKLTFRTPYMDNALVRLAYRAPSAARNSPASALRLIETGPAALGRIPTDRGYSCGRVSPLYPLRRLYCAVTFKLDYYDKEGLPKKLAFLDRLRGSLDFFGLLGLHKFLPYRHWFRDELAPHIADVLDSAATRQQPWWNKALLPKLGREHGRDGHNFLTELNAILTLEAVERTLIRELPDRSVSFEPAVVASGE
jgi:asparagine synthase (glutamine-hydrolysing)